MPSVKDSRASSGALPKQPNLALFSLQARGQFRLHQPCMMGASVKWCGVVLLCRTPLNDDSKLQGDLLTLAPPTHTDHQDADWTGLVFLPADPPLPLMLSRSQI